MQHGAAERVLQALAELQQIGKDASGGTTRLAYTHADVEGRKWLTERMAAAGLHVEVDAVGNVFGWLPGKVNSPPLLLGSHIDTVPGGGAYDGTLGVICSLEIVRSLTARGWRPRTPIGVVSFACEEGSRFGMSSIGSRALTGDLAPDDLSRLKDREGNTLREALVSAALSPDRVGELRREPGWFHAYLEAHIDQGPDLEEAGHPIAIVRVIAGTSRHQLTFLGQQAHAGAARMGRRSDAMAAAAEAVLTTETEASRRQEEVVATIGTIEAVPGIINVLPASVRLGLEIRALSADAATDVEEVLRARIEHRAAVRQVTVKWEVLSRSAPATMASVVREALADAFEEVGLAVYETVSWPGHDALYMAKHGLAGMVFVRNPARVSHHPAESVRAEDLELLMAVLQDAVARLSGQ